ncbi:MAG: glucose-6-phosphate isomerase [Beijerinckiaceae bacterium]|nr:glucose-6-phosphate isomerase [Beijerinckiaceae bacterium]MCZ8300450.1 glucose-6-phosphate isomerase [Beijerinckiaceae bacterium]
MTDSLAACWADLDAHKTRLAQDRTTDLFSRDSERFVRFAAEFEDMLLDLSKCRVDEAAMTSLVALAHHAGLAQARQAMFAGEPINATEGRAVLHVALRQHEGTRLTGGTDVMPDILATRQACFRFAEGIRNGSIATVTGAPFTDIVNIGIGGSDLGPAMAVEALRPYNDGPRVHFVSNVDGAHLADTLRGLEPARTLVIVASKTFTTIETMTNARSAREWMASALGEAAIGPHFAAVSTALDKVAAFGIPPERAFGFWDWVGGRYSIWSSIGLPLMIAIGPARFSAFLAGAEAMDRHFESAPLRHNLPALLGLIGVWHRRVWGHASRAIIPYDQRLHRFPAYLQQLDMESNGKSVRKDGHAVEGVTGPIVWGEPGTNGQHAFFQLLHQGTDVIPVEFLLAVEGHEPAYAHHHQLLIANCLAQSQALMVGRSLAEAKGNPHRVFPGDRPSITLLYRKLDPYTLGRLIALYEHRVFVEAAIYGINAFDQWGVELGKELATQLAEPLASGRNLGSLDGSTAGLIARIRGDH